MISDLPDSELLGLPPQFPAWPNLDDDGTIDKTLFPDPEPPSELFVFPEEIAAAPDTALSSIPPDAFQQPAHNPAQQLLNDIARLHLEQREQLERMCQIQKGVCMKPIIEAMQALDMDQKQMKVKLDSELKALVELRQRVILEPGDLHRLLFLEQELSIQLKQLELFYFELQSLAQPGTARCIAALVIVNQPFSQVLNKGKQLNEDQLVVRLLGGAATEFLSFTPVRTATVIETTQPVKGGAGTGKYVELDVQQMDPATRLAKFPLKFVLGTRRSVMTLRFGMQVQTKTAAGIVTSTIESNFSSPYVVITNESQWESSEGALLKKDAFGTQLETPWTQMANSLQRRFLVATRQDLLRPKRPLSTYDLHYLNTKFFGGRAVVHQKQFDEFWVWFGKCLQALRYQRHIASLWQVGLLYGFWSRDDVESQIGGQELGTFCIRFSERYPGQFGIAYIGSDNTVKHYLVQPNDTAGAKRTLPDFVLECPQFQTILQLTMDMNGAITVIKVRKQNALEQFVSRREGQQKPGGVGYDPLQ